MKINCIVCGKEIRMDNVPNTYLDSTQGVQLEKLMYESGIERIFYRCPWCGMEYTVMLTDEEIRALMKKRDKLKGYEKIKNQGIREQKKKEFETLDQEIKEKLEILNKK